MRQSLIGIVLLLNIGVIYCQSTTQPTAADFRKLDWLQGRWDRLDVKPGHSGHERWTKLSTTEWWGSGITLKGTDTVLIEKLKLVIKNDAIFYVSDVPENKQPVYFKFTAISDTSFVCENPGHDFPKKIIYQKDGNKLRATISGDGKSFDYLFEKEKAQ